MTALKDCLQAGLSSSLSRSVARSISSALSTPLFMILGENLIPRDRAQILLDIDALRDADNELEKEEDALIARIAELEAELKGLGEIF
jgi:hypothetical protein